MNISIGSISEKAKQSWQQTGKPVLIKTWGYAKDNPETCAGVAVGFVVGKAIEHVPVIGRLLGPLPSLGLAAYCGYWGHRMAMERRDANLKRQRLAS